MKRQVLAQLRHWIMVLGICLISLQAQAMECARTSTPVERMICASPNLQALDLRLNDVFRVAAVVSTETKLLRDAQRKWLMARDACPDEVCISDTYVQRIAVLTKLAPIKDVWLRAMPGRYRDAWLFYARGTPNSPFSAGEPVWVVNEAGLHTFPPAAVGPQWFERVDPARNRSSYPGKHGTRVLAFGFFSGIEISGSVSDSNPLNLVIEVPSGPIGLARVPRSLVVDAVAKYPLSEKTNPLALSFQSGCNPFSHVVEVHVPERVSPPAAWYGAREESGPSDREKLCRVDRVRFRYDELFGVETGLSWGDSGGHVLADGSFLLVSSLWSSVHVIRIRADGTVPPERSSEIKVVEWSRLEALRNAALEYCEAQNRSEGMEADRFAQCLVDRIEINL